MNVRLILMAITIAVSCSIHGQLNIRISPFYSPRNEIELGLALRTYLKRNSVWDSLKYSPKLTGCEITINSQGEVERCFFANKTGSPFLADFNDEDFTSFLKENGYLITNQIVQEFSMETELLNQVFNHYLPFTKTYIFFPLLLRGVFNENIRNLEYMNIPKGVDDIDVILDYAPLTIGALTAKPFEDEKIVDKLTTNDEYYNLMMLHYAFYNIFGEVTMLRWYDDPRLTPLKFEDITIRVRSDGTPIEVVSFKVGTMGVVQNSEIIRDKMMAFFRNYNVRFKVGGNFDLGTHDLVLNFPGRLYETYSDCSNDKSKFIWFCDKISATLLEQELSKRR